MPTLACSRLTAYFVAHGLIRGAPVRLRSPSRRVSHVAPPTPCPSPVHSRCLCSKASQPTQSFVSREAFTAPFPAALSYLFGAFQAPTVRYTPKKSGPRKARLLKPRMKTFSTQCRLPATPCNQDRSHRSEHRAKPQVPHRFHQSASKSNSYPAFCMPSSLPADSVPDPSAST